MITAPENSNGPITSLVLIDRGTIRPTLSALKTVLDGGDITPYHDVKPKFRLIKKRPPAFGCPSVPRHLRGGGTTR